MTSGHEITKAQAQRAAELATPDELQQFGNLHLLQQMCMAADDLKGVDEVAREGRVLVRQILKRDSRDHDH